MLCFVIKNRNLAHNHRFLLQTKVKAADKIFEAKFSERNSRPHAKALVNLSLNNKFEQSEKSVRLVMLSEPFNCFDKILLNKSKFHTWIML